ncbi:MAG: bile acid:sodium symporter [Planctomycetia bacterium]|nr:bile acid:sodium symporter [Planctomycetia bacterium]
MQLIIKLLVVVFVTTSMATLGLTLHTREIVGPWRRFNLVLSLLFSNLVLVPAIAYCFTKVFVLDETFETGLLLLGMAAGAPFVPKLIEVARADMALAVSMMLLQVLGTIIVLPLILPRFIPGVQANALQIATPLILQMLLPLIAGLVFRHFAPTWAKRINPPLMLISQLSALIVLIALFVINFQSMTAMLGSGALLASLCFVIVAMLVGYFTSFANGESSVVQTIATGQRNIPAALVVASNNPLPRDIVGMLMLTTFVGLIPIVGYAIFCGHTGTKRKTSSDS